MTTVDIPVVDETTARNRLDALVCEHGLPAPRKVITNISTYSGNVLALVNSRADVTAWAAVLGAGIETEKEIEELADGSWVAMWTTRATARKWAGSFLTLYVSFMDNRYVAPAVAR